MRESLSLRIATLAVALPVVAAACVIVLVPMGVLHPRPAHLVAAGGAILIVAILAAAISALGPKYRPTPLLTPLFAGVFAALLATTGLYAAHAQLAPKRAALAAVDIKPAKKPAATATAAPTKPAPVKTASAAAAEPPPGFRPMFDEGVFAPAAKIQDQMPMTAEPAKAAAEPAAAAAADEPPADGQPSAYVDQLPADDVQPLPGDEADRAAMGGPLADEGDAAAAPAKAEQKPAAAGQSPKTAVAVASVPLPAAAPEKTAKANADTPLTLTASFDPSGPVEPTATGAPMELDGPDAAAAAPAHHAATPPLPRIRPCGAAGPACP